MFSISNIDKFIITEQTQMVTRGIIVKNLYSLYDTSEVRLILH